MKRIFVLSTIIISSFGMMNAQNQQTPQGSNTAAKQSELPQVKAKRMVSEVNTVCMLQGDQFAKVNAVYIDYFTKLDALQKSNPSKSDLDSKTATLKNARNEALKGALNADQNKQWAAHVAMQKSAE